MVFQYYYKRQNAKKSGHTDTQTHRHTDTQTHRHTDTQTAHRTTTVTLDAHARQGLIKVFLPSMEHPSYWWDILK